MLFRLSWFSVARARTDHTGLSLLLVQVVNNQENSLGEDKEVDQVGGRQFL